MNRGITAEYLIETLGTDYVDDNPMNENTLSILLEEINTTSSVISESYKLLGDNVRQLIDSIQDVDNAEIIFNEKESQLEISITDSNKKKYNTIITGDIELFLNNVSDINTIREILENCSNNNHLDAFMSTRKTNRKVNI